jgi:hypothetical protein
VHHDHQGEVHGVQQAGGHVHDQLEDVVSFLIVASVNPIQANIVMMNDSAMLDLHVPPIDVM